MKHIRWRWNGIVRGVARCRRLLLLNTADKENNFNVGMPIPLIFLIGISTLFFSCWSRRKRSHIHTHHHLIHCRLIPSRNSVYNRIKALLFCDHNLVINYILWYHHLVTALITVINTDIWLSLILPPDNCLSGWENNFIDTSKNKRKSPQGVNNG